MHTLRVIGLSSLLAFTGSGSFVVSSAGAASAAIPTRDCSSAVEGNLAADWWTDRASVVRGSVGWPAVFARQLAVLPARRLKTAAGRYRPLKALLVVKQGTIVELSVPAWERRRLRLLYRTGQAGASYRLLDGDVRMRFVACPDRDTEFAGGFLASEAQCATIEIRVEGSSGSAERALIPIARRRASCLVDG